MYAAPRTPTRARGKPIDKEFTGTDRFEVQRRLGAGGMGVVYQVYDRERDSLVALKTLQQGDAGAIYRFKQEFRGLADISHPNIAALHELVSVGNQWFFTMELVDGTDFLSYLRGDIDPGACADTVADDDPCATDDHRQAPATPPPDLERVYETMRQLADGVHALHDSGKLHRDIKPSNVMVTRSGRVVLLDFGLITELAKAEDGPTQGNVVGTATYMAPEQGASLPLSTASDWYSVGVMLYEALTGRLPFAGPPLRVLMDKQRVEPTPPLELLPDLPADLAELCADLLRCDAEARPVGGKILTRLGRPPVRAQGSVASTRSMGSAFVGREHHLAALTEAFTSSRTLEATAVLLHGSSGMGKSLLVERFTEALASDHGVVVLSGRCYERESVPYKALDSLIDALTRHLVTLPRREVDALVPRDPLAIARLFPVLRRVESIADAPQRKSVPDPHETRQRALTALRELLARIADRSPLVLVIDDMQWGDIDSATLLVDLMRPPDPPPLLLLVCYRSEEVERSDALRVLLGTRDGDSDTLFGSWDASAAGFCRGDANTIELVVDALSAEEAEALARSRLGKDKACDQLARVIARESRGNPFFVDELVRYVQAGGAATSMTDLRLEDVMLARFEQLDPGSRLLLELVALAARPLQQTIACRAAAIRDAKDNNLAVLRAGHLVRTTGTRASDRIETYHDRIREAVVSHLTSAEIRDRHHRLARALEGSDYADDESLAIHLHGAGDVVRGASYAVKAAQHAAEILAFERSAALYRFAIENLPAADITRRELRRQLGDALANAGRGAEAAEEYMLATAGARAADGLDLRRRAAEQLLRSGYADRGIEALRAVLKEVGISMPRSPRTTLASLFYHRARLRLRGLAFKEHDTSQITAEELTRLDTCWSAATGLMMMDTISATNFQTRHLILALRAGEPRRVARALTVEAALSALGGAASWRRTMKLVRTSQALSERIEDPYANALAFGASGIAEYQRGHWRAGFEGLERSHSLLRERCAGATHEIAGAQRFAIDALHNLGEIRELCRRVPRHLRDAQRRGNLHVAADMRTGLPNIAWLAGDDPDGARREARLGIECWSRDVFHLQHYYDALAQAHIDLYLGEGAAAHRRVVAIWAALKRRLFMRIQAVRNEATFLRGRAAIAAAHQESNRRARLREADKLASRLGREPTPAAPHLAVLLRANIAAVNGDKERAGDLLASAASGLADADMLLYAAAARRHRGQLIGGDEGRDLVEQADAWMTSEAIVAPARMAALCSPASAEY